MSKKKKYFVVWDGREPGIYKTWEECKKQTHGYDRAKFKGFETEMEARKAFLSPYIDYVSKKPEKPAMTTAQLEKYGKPVIESIAVDAACSGNPGMMEYRGVYTKTGEEIFRQGPFPEGTNNVGEFLALVHGLALLKQKNSDLPVYSDSSTAIGWIKAKKHRSKLERTENNKAIFDLLQRAEKWLAENNYSTKILKWETEVWGEIPADFGRK